MDYAPAGPSYCHCRHSHGKCLTDCECAAPSCPSIGRPIYHTAHMRPASGLISPITLGGALQASAPGLVWVSPLPDAVKPKGRGSVVLKGPHKDLQPGEPTDRYSLAPGQRGSTTCTSEAPPPTVFLPVYGHICIRTFDLRSPFSSP